MAKPSLCIIYNPSAGRGFTGSIWQNLQVALGNAAEYQPTRHPEHAVELAMQAAKDGFSTVAAAGGDGTVHEVANGLLRADKSGVAFGVIPLGSGNDYARMLKVPTDPNRLAQLLLGQEAWPVDAGLVTADGGRTQRYFVNTLGLGLSGVVTYEARQIKWLRGLSLYGLAALKAVYRSFRAIPTALEFDGQATTGATLYLSIALGAAEGGGFVVAPDAQLDDGWFDYLHAGSMTRLRALSYLPRMALGLLPESGGAIRRGRCQRVRIVADEPLHCHCDGELFSDPTQPACRFDVRLLPAALKIRGTRPAG